jgi:hypothetical protein
MKMNLSVKEIDGDIIIIYPSCLDQEGKSSFLYKASKPEIVPMYEELLFKCKRI